MTPTTGYGFVLVTYDSSGDDSIVFVDFGVSPTEFNRSIGGNSQLHTYTLEDADSRTEFIEEAFKYFMEALDVDEVSVIPDRTAPFVRVWYLRPNVPPKPIKQGIGWSTRPFPSAPAAAVGISFPAPGQKIKPEGPVMSDPNQARGFMEMVVNSALAASEIRALKYYRAFSYPNLQR